MNLLYQVEVQIFVLPLDRVSSSYEKLRRIGFAFEQILLIKYILVSTVEV